jgi:geranylgeranylglycerol-phosphate geranylgeranyltransferase
MTETTVKTVELYREGRAGVQRLLALVRLVRPLNMGMLIAGVFVGGFLVVGAEVTESGILLTLLIAAVSVVTIAGGANALNDVIDLAADRINRPHRPVAAGMVSASEGKAVWMGGTVLGILLAWTISLPHFAIAAAASGLMIAYNLRLKATPLAGNLVVSLVVAVSILFGAMAVGSASGALYAAAFAFLVTLARELVKDVEDLRGDVAAGVRTAASAWGVGIVRRLVASVIGLTVLFTPAPFITSGYSGLYLSIVLIANVFLVSALADVLDGDSAMSRASSRLKWAMLIGMIALASAHALE